MALRKVKCRCGAGRRILSALALCGLSPAAWAGAYIFAGEGNGVDLITHPTGYNGAGTSLAIDVCIHPASPNLAQMEQSVRNIIAVWNQQLPTSGNIRNDVISGGEVDFESVALHELGHCIGEAHVNAASESGLVGDDRNYTKATDGADNNWDLDDGADNEIGSGDDIRGDDINLHWYRTANNNPFTIDHQTVDSTTYARNTGSLPGADTFAANGDRTAGANVFATPNTEAVMQQLTFFGEIQRTLTHDGVATIRLGMSGSDEIQGTADDYSYTLNYGGAAANCDINLDFDNSETGFAVCQTGGQFIGSGHAKITSADIFFNTGYNWFFNTAAPCSANIALPQNQWTMFTLPCSTGISTGNTVADIMGDDLAGTPDVDWVVYEYDAANGLYTRLTGTDEMFTGTGYWTATNQAGQSFDVEGQFNGSPDIFLSGAGGGRPNLVGHPFDFNVDWSDVQVVDGADVQTLAAAVADGDISETYHVWNGGSYQAFDASTPGMIGTLVKGESLWVKAFKDGIYLRVPSIDAGPPRAPDGGGGDGSTWYVRLTVESGDLRDSGNVLGQTPDARDGLDHRDLEEPAPFGDTWLSIVFPHEEWGGNAWGYTSDFRSVTRTPQGEWFFAVRSSAELAAINLRLEGPDFIMQRARLTDLETGRAVRLTGRDYSFRMRSGERLFRFSVGGM